MSKNENIRLLALESLLLIEKAGRKSDDVTDAVLDKYSYLPRNERAFYTRLVRGTLENRQRADMIINTYSNISAKKMKPAIRWILRMAVYQMEKMDSVPESAVVNEAVKLAEAKGFRTLKGFVNGVLRSMIREPERFREPGKDKPSLYLQAVYSIPAFLADRWTERFGLDTAERICASFEGAGGITVRIRHDPEKTLRSLDEAGITYECAPYVPYAYRLYGVDRLTDLAAFRNGSIIVQDVSSMLAVYAAGIKKGDFITDVCAAPGGKSILAADLTGETGQVLSGDISDAKIRLVEENTERCGIKNIKAEVRDASVPDASLSGKADVVLADAPCTGYGVIGKKCDIAFSASEEKEKALSELQKKILSAASGHVRPGGVLIYSTCTISRAENEDNVQWFLKEHEKDGFRAESLKGFIPGELMCETAENGYIQLLPGIHDCDGFFVARFRREKE